MDRSVGFLDAMRDASFNARRRRQRSVRRLVNSDDYDFAAQWRVASEFVTRPGEARLTRRRLGGRRRRRPTVAFMAPHHDGG